MPFGALVGHLQADQYRLLGISEQCVASLCPDMPTSMMPTRSRPEIWWRPHAIALIHAAIDFCELDFCLNCLPRTLMALNLSGPILGERLVYACR